MMQDRSYSTPAWLACVVAVASLSVGCKRENPSDTTSRAAVPVDGHLRVEAGENGFSPATVAVAKGQKLTLDFVRTSQNTCATEVVFPELKIEKKLPLAESVPIEIPTGEARTLAFQCGMGMYQSKIVIQ